MKSAKSFFVIYNILGGIMNIIYYIVKKGDNLSSIANLYEKSIDELMKDNSLRSNLVNYYQIIKVKLYKPILYRVKHGDSIYSIAKKYQITINYLKEKNNLSSNYINIGSIIYI